MSNGPFLLSAHCSRHAVAYLHFHIGLPEFIDHKN